MKTTLRNAPRSGKYDRHLMAVGAVEAVGFLLAAVLAAGVVSGCYTLTGQPLGGGKTEASPCAGKEAGCIYFSEKCPPSDYQCVDLPKDAANGADAKDSADSKSVDAGPQATYPDGADGGTCYADVCAMPKECPADAPPVCWWFCKDYAGTWDCGKGEKGTTVFITDGSGYCGIQFWWGDTVGALPGTPPPLVIYKDWTVAPYGNDGKKLIHIIDGQKIICTKVE